MKNSCESCGYAFEHVFDFYEHLNTHSGETPFKCSTCGSKFALICDYVEHARLSCDTKKFCNLCRTICDKNLFNQHKCIEPIVEDKFLLQDQKNKCKFSEEVVKNEAEDPLSTIEISEDIKKETFQCVHCSKKFNKRNLLRLHLQRYPDRHGFPCNVCSKMFITATKLQKHLCLLPSAKEPIYCSCLKTFHSLADFKSHVAPSYNCCECQMKFLASSNLIRHIRTHTKQKPYACQQCGRTFAQASTLRNHLTIHDSVSAIKCDLCSFSCKTKAGLHKHKRKHLDGGEFRDLRKVSSKIFRCNECCKEFRFRRNLAMHMKVHEVENMLCAECGKIFETRRKLKVHLRMYHGEPVTCPVCLKTFRSASYLKAHSKIHNSEKQFICPICNKAFAMQNYMMQHRKTHNANLSTAKK